MNETANLSLPYILASQAQKHVTHNEAIRALDCLVQPEGVAPEGFIAEGIEAKRVAARRDQGARRMLGIVPRSVVVFAPGGRAGEARNADQYPGNSRQFASHVCFSRSSRCI